MPMDISSSSSNASCTHTNTPRHLSLLHIRRRKSLNHTRAIHESCPENAVCVREHAVLQTDDDKLTAAESCADQTTDVLSV
jgi:hypothetical protein